MTDRSLLPARGSPAGPPSRVESPDAERPAERRHEMRREPWRLVAGRGHPTGRFVAIHQLSGRSVRLDAADAAEARTQVELLNRRTLEVRA